MVVVRLYAITAMAVLTDGQMIVGDGTTDPVAESGATLRTSIGVGTGDDVVLTSLETSGNISGSSTSTGSFGQVYSDKKIGIGTTSPEHQLDIVSSGNAELELTRTSGVSIFMQAQSAVGVIGTSTNHPLRIITNNGGAVYITTGGNVGIGETSPSEKLEVIGNGLFTGDLTVGGKVTAEQFHTEFVSSSILFSSGSTKFGDTQDDIHNFTGSFRQSGSEADHYFLTGKVGIGTASPFSELAIVGNTNNSSDTGADAPFGISVVNSNTTANSYSQINLLNGGAPTTQNDGWAIRSLYQANNDADLTFNLLSNSGGTAVGSEKVRIDVSGNIGIGTTSPNEKLEVVGNIRLSNSTNSTIYQDSDSEFLRIGVGGATSDRPRIEIYGKDYGGSNAGGNITLISGGDSNCDKW